MAIETDALRTRRAILAASLGGVAATVVTALGRPAIVRAGSDGDVVLGGMNSTASSTVITDTTSGGTTLSALAKDSGIAVSGETDSGYGVLGSSTSGYGVRGHSGSGTGVYADSDTGTGVVGTSDSGFGVSGTSPNSTGVIGSSGSGVGVHAYSNATNQAAGRGWSGGNGTGLLGYSGDNMPPARARTGVYGEASQDSTSVGVFGRTTLGQAVHGDATAGRGVQGEATTGYGVRGYATIGTALYGQTRALKDGVALRTIGKVKFDNSVGLATILAGTNSVTVSPGIDLTATTAIVATLQGDPGGTTTIQRVAVDAAGDTFTIWLTANTVGGVNVAWHAFG